MGFFRKLAKAVTGTHKRKHHKTRTTKKRHSRRTARAKNGRFKKRR